MELMLYVANDEDLAIAQQLIADIAPISEADQVGAVNLHGAQLESVPGVVLQVMRLKRTGTMPLTVAEGKPLVSGEWPTRELLRRALQEGVETPAVLVSHADSAVQFPTASRLHLSMFVNDLSESVAFYQVFFGQPPTKLRADYAKFEVEEPPLNIAFSQDRKPVRGVGPVNHMGVQVKSSELVLAARDRFRAAGFEVEEEIATACCYAVQTKIWVGDPDGNRWEWFVTTQAEAEAGCGPDCPCYSEIAPSRVGPETARMPLSV